MRKNSEMLWSLQQRTVNKQHSKLGWGLGTCASRQWSTASYWCKSWGILPRLLGGDGPRNRSAIKIQAGLGLRAMHESSGNKALITNLFALIIVDLRSAPPSPWRVAVMINSNQICSREGIPHSLLHIMRSGEEN